MMKRLLLPLLLTLVLSGCNICFWCDVDVQGQVGQSFLQAAFQLACVGGLLIAVVLIVIFIGSDVITAQAEERDLQEYRNKYK